MTGSFILYNGSFSRPEEKLFSLGELKQFLFGDELKMIKSNILFWDDHVKLLTLQFQLFHLKLPEFMHHNGKELKRQLERCLTKNKAFRSANIQLSFFHTEDHVNYLVDLVKEQEITYQLQPEGIFLSLYKNITKSDSPLSSLKIGSKTLWEIALYSNHEKKTIPVILSNSHCLLETPGSNLFLIHNNTISTPHPASGAYVNPAKRVIQQIAGQAGLNFQEEDKLQEEDLLTAEEVFLADDILGIQYVRAFGMKRYFKKKIMNLNELFNQALIH